MKLKKTNVQHVFASLEQAQFTTNEPNGELTISQEGFGDIFKSIGQAWTNWRMARINKRGKVTARDIQALRTWGYSIKRQISRTYGEPRWISQKINPELTEIPMAEYSKLFTLTNQGEIASFTSLTTSMNNATNNVSEMLHGVEKYIGLLAKEIQGVSRNRAYDEIAKAVRLLGTPRDFIAREIQNLGDLPNNLELEYTPDSREGLFVFRDAKKPHVEIETLPALEEKDFKAFVNHVYSSIDSLTENNYFDKEVFVEREMFADAFEYVDQEGDRYVDLSDNETYNAALRGAYANRDRDVIEALSPEYWNMTLTSFLADVATLNLELTMAYVEYMNRHLK